jgi:hypothetical protein
MIRGSFKPCGFLSRDSSLKAFPSDEVVGGSLNLSNRMAVGALVSWNHPLQAIETPRHTSSRLCDATA